MSESPHDASTVEVAKGENVSYDGFCYEVSQSSGSTQEDITVSNEQSLQIPQSSFDPFVFFKRSLQSFGFFKTLEVFNEEIKSINTFDDLKSHDSSGAVNDIHFQYLQLSKRFNDLSTNYKKLLEECQNVWKTKDRLIRRRQRDRMLLGQLEQEKSKLIKDLVRVKKHCESFDPLISKLRARYELMMKEKSLMRIDRDKFAGKVSKLKKKVEDLTSYKENTEKKCEIEVGGLMTTNESVSCSFKEFERKHEKRISDKNWKSQAFSHSSSKLGELSETKKDLHSFSTTLLKMTNKIVAHQSSISSVCSHPNQDYVVSCGDDTNIRIWAIPSGELVVSLNSSHQAWISAAKFHPNPSHFCTCLLASSSGDKTVKIWDLQSCSEEFELGLKAAKETNKPHTNLTLDKDPVKILNFHTAAVWDLDWCAYGMKLVTASMDQTLKLFDCFTFKPRLTFRGHADSVNSCQFGPHSDNIIVSGSADKSVSIWDARSSNCEITLFGHNSSIQDAKFHPTNERYVASCDLKGEICLWDIRKVTLFNSAPCVFSNDKFEKAAPLNCIGFDMSGVSLCAGSDDGSLKCFTLSEDMKLKQDLETFSHEGSLSSFCFSHDNSCLITGGSDRLLKIWQTGK